MTNPVNNYARYTVGDVMTTAVISMKASEKMLTADAEMKLADVRHLPVVDDAGHVVGILSNRDVFKSLGSGARSRLIGDIMSTRVHTVLESTPIQDAADIMLERKISALPVVGDGAQLIGLLTETDLLRLAFVGSD